jgi:microcin C transport system substrate-binding protein
MLGLAGAAIAPSAARAQAATTISHGLAIHGEPGYPADARHWSFANPDAPKGGTMRDAAHGSFDSLNEFILKGTSVRLLSNVFETLSMQALDEPATDYCLLAETIEVPTDRAWAIFTLRPQARWHDGKPVTADDVVFSFDTLKEKGSPTYGVYWQNVKSAEKLDERRVRFAFSDANNRELANIIGQLPVLPKHWWASREFDRTTLEIPLGSGPYRVESLEPGRFIVLRRVEDYWGRDLWLNRGRNNFDVLRTEYFRDETVAFEAFKAGSIDYREENTPRQWALSYDFPAVKSGAVQKVELSHESALAMQGVVFNLRRETYRDRRFREAFVHLIDFEWFNKTLSYGLLTRVDSYFFNSELAASALPSPEELKYLEPLRSQIPPEVFTQPFKLPVTDGSGNNRESLRRAIALLKEAGWEVRNGKMTNLKSGRPLSFELLLGEPRLERFGLPFKQWCERIGIEVRLRTVDAVQYQKRMEAFDYEATIDVWANSLSPGNEQREFWGSKAADTQGSRNTIGIKDPAVDTLIEQLIAAPDRPSLVACSRALDRVLLWNFYVVPQYQTKTYWVAFWNRFGRPQKQARYIPNGYDTWWFDPAKDKALQVKP